MMSQRESQLALDRKVAARRYRSGMDNFHPSYFSLAAYSYCWWVKDPVSQKHSMIPGPGAELAFSSPWHLWCCFPSRRATASTVSSLGDSPSPTSRALSPVQRVSGRNCSSCCDEYNFKPCLFVVPPLCFSALRINPVCLLNRKLALTLLLPGAWVSDIASSCYFTWQRPISMWTRSLQRTVSWKTILSLPLPKAAQVSRSSFPLCSLWDAGWIISPTWCMCLFVVSLHTSPWVPSIVLSWISHFLLSFPLLPFSNV